jgi:Ca2+-transporting ATPase
VRNGERQRVPARDIVPDDIVLVEAGDNIPADARIIEDANLHTDEAPLTGESMPVTKNPRPLASDIGLGDRVNMLFAGTVATYGRGRAVVVATGMQTEVGKIAGLLEAAEKEPTPLQQELDRTGKRLTVVMLGICALVFAAGLFSAKAFTLNIVLSMFLFAVALAVAAIPEALPAIVTIGLSLGVRRMAAAHAIVRKLPAIETLGAATVICSDKTGTLTRNEMTVRAIFCTGSVVEVGGSGYIPEGEFSCEGKALPGTSVRHEPDAESRASFAAGPRSVEEGLDVGAGPRTARRRSGHVLGDPGQRLGHRAAVLVEVVLGLHHVAEIGAFQEDAVAGRASTDRDAAERAGAHRGLALGAGHRVHASEHTPGASRACGPTRG